MKFHELKTWPNPFDRIRRGVKTAEFRRDDRGFEIGHGLKLLEWDPVTGKYTGEEEIRVITDIARDGAFGITPGYAMLSMRQISAKDLDRK